MAPEHVGFDAYAVLVGQLFDSTAEVVRTVAHAAQSEPRAQSATKGVVPAFHRLFTFLERLFGIFAGQVFGDRAVGRSMNIQGRTRDDSSEPGLAGDLRGFIRIVTARINVSRGAILDHVQMPRQGAYACFLFGLRGLKGKMRSPSQRSNSPPSAMPAASRWV